MGAVVDDPLVLFVEPYWQSPWCCACWVALREKGLPFARSLGIMPGGHLLDELRARALLARVPMLQHGEFFLSQSLAIVDYLEDAYPPPRWPAVLPRDPRERARARQVSIWTRTELHALRRDAPAGLMFYPEPPVTLGPAARAEADELLETAARLLRGRPGWLFEDFTIADLDVAWALRRLPLAAIALPAELVAYVERVWDRPSVAEYVRHPRPPNPPLEDANTRR